MNEEVQTELSQFAENLEDDAAIAETHEFTEDLEDHAAVEIKSVCHAITSYPASDVNESEGERKQYTGKEYDETMCGIEPVKSVGIKPRKEFLADNIPMCLTCWPEHITPDETLSPKYRGLHDRI
jgi:hypothetical protein